MLERTNVSAIAVTGAPSNFPINVVFPISCARDAVKARAATLPQLSDGEIIEDASIDDADADKAV